MKQFTDIFKCKKNFQGKVSFNISLHNCIKKEWRFYATRWYHKLEILTPVVGSTVQYDLTLCFFSSRQLKHICDAVLTF